MNQQRFIIQHTGTGTLSRYTTLNGIYEVCFESVVINCEEADAEKWKQTHQHPTREQKLQVVESICQYKLLLPTPTLIEKWETYHQSPFPFYQYLKTTHLKEESCYDKRQ